MSRLFFVLIVLAAWLGAGPAMAQESAVTNRSTELKAEPRDDAVGQSGFQCKPAWY